MKSTIYTSCTCTILCYNRYAMTAIWRRYCENSWYMSITRVSRLLMWVILMVDMATDSQQDEKYPDTAEKALGA
eukprot:6188426-Pleurochrysis_carterae.AAC.1